MFKYKSCVGSSVLHMWVKPSYRGLNTNLVSVRVVNVGVALIVPNKFKYKSCVGSSQGTIFTYTHPIEFKYKSCVGSSKNRSLLLFAFESLNTNLVSVRVNA